VLLADDDPWIRESVGFLLRDAGYQVLEAADGVETLDMLVLSEHPLVVVLDLVMPRMTGFEVLQRVARDAHLGTHHAYVVCSALAGGPQRVGEHFTALLELLQIAYVARPFDMDVLLAAVGADAERLYPGSGARRLDDLA
jgi:CheY-like chemotaxis protein